MKKILLTLTMMALLISACSSETPVDEETDTDMVATVVAEMMAATATAQVEAAALEAAAATEAPTEVIPAPTLSADFENAAPIQTQLIIGIYQLENTALAITKEEASALYPTFLSLQMSITNQTLTEAESNSLVLQQVAALRAEQVQAITDLQITQEIVMTAMQQLGFESGGRGGGGGQAGQAPQGDAAGGGPPSDASGQPPQGGGGAPPEGETGTNTLQGERNNFLSPELVDAIINFLESKINS